MAMRKQQTSGNLALAGYDDIFNAGKPNHDGESVVAIPLVELFPPEFHPFQILDDPAMERLVKSVKQYGVREPGLARPRAEGGYELLSGNRRKRACELAGIDTMPVIVREMDDDNAAITMVDANLEQRERLLFSERAWAYRIKLEALNHRGMKSDEPGELSVEILCEQTGESKNQIFRLVRLTELGIALLDRVDAKQLAFNPAVELSYLTQVQQSAVSAAMDKYAVKPSLSQSVRLKKLNKAGTLTFDMIEKILSEDKKPPEGETAGSMRFRKYFPSDYTRKQMDAVIAELLKGWKERAAI